METGLKVVRGPHWRWENQDGGEGNTGVVARVGKKGDEDVLEKCVIVQWSSGSKNLYRAGINGMYDLRVLDNSNIGVEHPGVKCDSCDSWNFNGMRWKCKECDDYDLCSKCYMADKHDVKHAFWCIETSGCEKVAVPKRQGSAKQKLKQQCSFSGGRATLEDVLSQLLVHILEDDSDSPQYYYKDHLPLLGKEKVAQGTFKFNDKVMVISDMSTVKALQEGHGGWASEMSDSVGEVGLVVGIYSDGDLKVKIKDTKWTFNPQCVRKIAIADASDSSSSSEEATAKKLGISVPVGVLKAFLESIFETDDKSSTEDSVMSSVKKLIKQGTDVNQQDNHGDTPLHAAAECNNHPVIDVFLENGANKDLVNKLGQTALHVAVTKQHVESVKMLLQHHSNVNIQDCHGDTPLHVAISKESHEIIDLLFNVPEADFSLRNNQGYCILYSAVLEGNNFLVDRLITKSPQMVNNKMTDGYTALHLASMEGHFDVASTLLRKGHCEVDARNNQNETALLLTVFACHCSLVELLVFMGADVNAEDEKGNTCLHVALRAQSVRLTCDMTNSPVIAKIVSEVSSVTHDPKNYGVAIACFLARKGGDVLHKNREGKTPFDLAATSEVRDLLQRYSGTSANVLPKVVSEEPVTTTTAMTTTGSVTITSAVTTTTAVTTSTAVTECQVCSEVRRLVLFEPCGHRIACVECCSRMKKCIECKAEIVKKVTADGLTLVFGRQQSGDDVLLTRYELKRLEILEAMKNR